MPSYFFKIGTTDISSYIDIQTYAVNREDVYEEWTDGNWVLHREIARTRRSGTFQVGFSKAADFASFMALLSSAKTADGYYSVSAYISNTGSSDTFDAYLDVSNDDDKWDAVNSRQWQVTTVTVTER